VLQREIERQYGAKVIGTAPEILEDFFAISVERRITHPCVTAITETARARAVCGPRQTAPGRKS
jgi:LysR family transcriptional regulator, transcriptional activator of nhaA